ncbi:MAG TPA: alpha/beta hydrolase [Ktedonosporobacter sp.]|nr:alpha/beta hydrolase [Ktedonosporobacter sp.]
MMPISPVRDELLLAGNLTLHSVQWGKQGSPIVCLHGLTANAFCFQALADDLASDHRVFAYDLRGRGDSEKPAQGYNVPLHAADLANFLDAAGLERPVVIGHSLGALIALYFAAHYPERLSKLVLIDAGGPLPWKTPEEQPAWLTTSISRLGQPVPSFEEYIARLKWAPFLGPYWNEYVDLYFTHDARHNDDGSVTAKAYREGILEEGLRFAEARPEEQWSGVKVPTLLLRAGQGLFFDNDQLLPEETAQAIRQGIVSCQYVNFPSLNHYTIVFGVEGGPAQEIRKFVEKE